MLKSVAGWRGAIGRALPDRLVRRILLSHPASIESKDYSIESLRARSNHGVERLAQQTDVSLRYSLALQRYQVASADWEVLKTRLADEGFHLRLVKGDKSNAANNLWSVREPSVSAHLNERMPLGLSSLWEVFPGGIEMTEDVQDFLEPIDAVYTWVDSSDSHWKDNFTAALADSDNASMSSTNRARFTSRDELRYSLRSLEVNLPWINKIYLVTAGQVPSWLETDNTKIVVVDHNEIFADQDSCLPTFNSHAIESRLSYIKNLSEHFIYVNDDVFFGRPLHPNSFFGAAGQVKYSYSDQHFSSSSADAHLPVNQAANNNRSLMRRAYGRTTSRKFKHVAHPQRRAVHERAFELFANELQATARNRFRSPDDVSLPSALAHQIAAREGLGISTEVDYAYVDIAADDVYLKLLRLLNNEKPQMFCINEVVDTADSDLRSEAVVHALQALFPVPSSFEK